MSTIRDPEGEELSALTALVSWHSKDVLEVGSGDGRLSLQFAASARSVLAIDPDEDAVAMARETLPDHLAARVEMRAEDVRETVLSDGAYDLAVLSWSL